MRQQYDTFFVRAVAISSLGAAAVVLGAKLEYCVETAKCLFLSFLQPIFF